MKKLLILILICFTCVGCGSGLFGSSNEPVWTSETINQTSRNSQGTSLLANNEAVFVWSRDFKNAPDIGNVSSQIVKIDSSSGATLAKSEVKLGVDRNSQPMTLYDGRIYAYTTVIDLTNPQEPTWQAYLWVLSTDMTTISYAPIKNAASVAIDNLVRVGQTLYLAGATNTNDERGSYVTAFDLSTQPPTRGWTYYTSTNPNSPDYAGGGINNLLADERGIAFTMYSVLKLDFQQVVGLDLTGKRLWGANLKDAAPPSGYTPQAISQVPITAGLTANTVIVSSMSQLLTGFDRSTGKPVFNKIASCGGVAGSQMTYDNIVYFSMSMGRCILAIDQTGKILFGQDITKHFTFGQALAIHNGVIYTSNTVLYGFDAKTGEVVGTSSRDYQGPVPNVVVSGDKIITGTDNLRAYKAFR